MNNRHKQHRRPNRATRLIVSAVSLIVIVAIAVPWVDEYYDLRRDAAEISDLESEIAQVRQRQAALQRVETKLEEELSPYLQHNITAQRTETVREALIEIVRSSKALLRQLEVIPNETRSWMVEDDVRNESAPLYGQDSRFELQSLSIELQADGSLSAIKNVLAGVKKQGWLATTRTINILPTTTKDKLIGLELRLTVFGLAPVQEVPTSEDEFEFDDMARRPGDRQVR